MTRSRRFSRSSARTVLSLILSLAVLSGCSTSYAPTYNKREIGATIEKILREEYETLATAKLAGSTLWVYVPVENLFEMTSGNDPRDKVKERFEIEQNSSYLRDGLLSVNYLIKPILPEREKDQGAKVNKKAMEKFNHAWDVMRRVIFSMDRAERDEVQFYVLVAADIVNGLELRQTIYYKDLIKVMYRIISPGEYHHRVPVKTGISIEIIGDKEGKSVKFRDVSFREFLCGQIEHRIGLKFQKPEVEQSADMDKEIHKVVLETLKIYDFSDFRVGELNNLQSSSVCRFDAGDVRELVPLRR